MEYEIFVEQLPQPLHTYDSDHLHLLHSTIQHIDNHST